VTVSVTIDLPGAGTTPNGDTVTVSDGSATCTVTLSSAGGSCSLTSTTAGNKTVTATYNGDANFNASTSAGVGHTVNKGNTATTITSNTPNPSTVGQSVTINYAVTVNSPGAGTLTGNVTVSDGLGNSCTAAVAAGTCSITFNTAGTKTLSATYAGDTNFNTSVSTGTSQTVNPKLVVTSIAFAILTGTCSSQVSVQTQNANGSAANQTPGITLNLSSNSGGGKFFSDPSCNTQVSSVAINSGTSTASLYYSDTIIGSPVITVVSTGLTSVMQSENITSLRFGTGAFSVPVNTCSAAISLQSAN
jgi:large repetitive protein